MELAAALDERSEPGLAPSIVLAAAVHALLAVILLLGVRWQNRPPDAVVVELWSEPPALERPQPPQPVPEASKPEPRIEKPDIAIQEPRSDRLDPRCRHQGRIVEDLFHPAPDVGRRRTTRSRPRDKPFEEPGRAGDHDARDPLRM